MVLVVDFFIVVILKDVQMENHAFPVNIIRDNFVEYFV